MGEFASTCDLRIMEDAGSLRVKLLAPLRYESDVLGRPIVVPRGFECDLSSVPGVGSALTVGAITPVTGARAAVVHDWLLVSKEVDRPTADRVFDEALEAVGRECCKTDAERSDWATIRNLMVLAVSALTATKQPAQWPKNNEIGGP